MFPWLRGVRAIDYRKLCIFFAQEQGGTFSGDPADERPEKGGAE